MKAEDVFKSSSKLGKALIGNEAQVEELTIEGTAIRAWLGVDGHGKAAVYIELPSEGTTDFAVSQAISVETLIVEEARRSETVQTIKVTCHEAQLTSVFLGFIDEVFDRVSLGTDPGETIRIAAAEWRRLLQIAKSEMSDSTAVGLYGELRFLEDLLTSCGPQCLVYWQRSHQDVHDFIGDSARVEVKSSTFQNHSSVTIHGLRQLEPPANATLTLAVADIQKVGEETLDDVINRIVDTGVDIAVLTQKLADVGLVKGMPSASEQTFTLLRWKFWEITAESSVLNTSALDPPTADSVSDLTYRLNIGALGEGRSMFNFDRFLPGQTNQ